MKDFKQGRRSVVDKRIHSRTGGCRFESWWRMLNTNYLEMKECPGVLGKLENKKGDGKKYIEC